MRVLNLTLTSHIAISQLFILKVRKVFNPVLITIESSVCFRFIGNESTLFVVLIASSFDFKYFHNLDIRDRVEKIERCLKEKLPLIPHTKFVIIDDSSREKIYLGEIPSETLQVRFPERIGLGAMVELLNKRYKSLDLITAMLELKRTYLKTCYEKHPGGFIVRYPSYDEFDVRENLSCLPRLQKVEQM